MILSDIPITTYETYDQPGPVRSRDELTVSSKEETMAPEDMFFQIPRYEGCELSPLIPC